MLSRKMLSWRHLRPIMAKRILEFPGSTLRLPRTKGAIRKNVEKFKDYLRTEQKNKVWESRGG